MNHLERHTRRDLPVSDYCVGYIYCTGCDWDSLEYPGLTFAQHLGIMCNHCGFPWNDEERTVDEHNCQP